MTIEENHSTVPRKHYIEILRSPNGKLYCRMDEPFDPYVIEEIVDTIEWEEKK